MGVFIVLWISWTGPDSDTGWTPSTRLRVIGLRTTAIPFLKCIYLFLYTKMRCLISCRRYSWRAQEIQTPPCVWQKSFNWRVMCFSILPKMMLSCITVNKTRAQLSGQSSFAVLQIHQNIRRLDLTLGNLRVILKLCPAVCSRILGVCVCGLTWRTVSI